MENDFPFNSTLHIGRKLIHSMLFEFAKREIKQGTCCRIGARPSPLRRLTVSTVIHVPLIHFVETLQAEMRDFHRHNRIECEDLDPFQKGRWVLKESENFLEMDWES
jgi:hypothetical protein